MKERAVGPGDEPEDVAPGVWGGHIPLRRVADAAGSDADVPGAHAAGSVPADVVARARDLGAR